MDNKNDHLLMFNLISKGKDKNIDKPALESFWTTLKRCLIAENLNNLYYEFISKEMLEFMDAYEGKKARNEDGI